MSPVEIVHGKEFTGKLCRFGEPVFGYCKVEGKATAKWKRMLFVGKAEPHDTYILYDGSGLVLTRSVRHIDVNWKSHLKYYYMFSHWSWEYKPGYGGRVLPTKSSKTALGASYSGPTGSIEPSPFVDEDAEAVRQKHLEEVREEEETNEMSLHDRPQPVSQAEIQEEPAPASQGVTIDEIFADDGPVSIAYQPEPIVPARSNASSSMPMPADVPQTPEVIPIAPSTPRATASTRVHDVHSDDESNDAKRARVESAKKQRLNRISQEYSAQIRTVKIADDVFHTMEEYQSDLRLDDHDMDDEWYEETEIAFGALPKELWSDNPLDQKPDDPSHEIDLQIKLNL